MKGLGKTTIQFLCVCSLLCLQESNANNNSLAGHWKLLPEKSSSIDPWRTLTLDIRLQKDTIIMVKTFSAGNQHDVRRDSIGVSTEGKEQIVPIPSGRWLGGVSMGVYYGSASVRRLRARWNADESQLSIDFREVLETSQGVTEITVNQTFAISSDGSTLTLTEARSTRAASPMRYEFVRLTE
ncbi:MAG: hypothetical protein OEM41_08555 [Ignavibacteria bacterium]|nr:hypothetical protein [Ignavibacteria bacterium]